MCFGGEDERRPVNHRRKVKRMSELGYEVHHPVPGRHPITGHDIVFYPIRRFHDDNIALLAESIQDGYLIVSQLYLNRDERSVARRPLAAEILLSFWKYEAGLPVSSLSGVLFQTVDEPATRSVRREVYRALRVDHGREIHLRSDRREHERHEFVRARDDSKLGRCVRTITTDFIEMKGAHAGISQVDFIPQGTRGHHFHLKVTLEYGRSPGR